MAEKDFPNTYEVLDEYGEKILDGIEDILLKNGKRATGNLINSLDYDIEDKGDGNFTLIIEYADYGKYVLSGRKRGAKMPPIEEIKKWLIAKRLNIKKSNYTVQPFGNKKLKQNAFMIARGIKRNGIKPLNFLSPYQKAENSTEFLNDVANAYVKDIEDNIEKITNEE